MKIVFGQPKYCHLAVHGVEVVYSYKVIHSYTDNSKNEEKKIKVFIDRLLANKLGFQLWSPVDHYYDGLMKLILPDVIEEIKRYYSGELKDFDNIILLETNQPAEKIQNIDKLPEVAGFEVIVEIL